jgi:hypothetical protein
MDPQAQALIDEAKAYYLSCGFEPVVAWPEKEANNLFRIAQALMRRHDHEFPVTDSLVSENCGACVLAGRNPNYAGWARVFVEGRRAIDLGALRSHLFRKDNPAYSMALLRSCLTFGVMLNPIKARKSKRS